MIWPPGSPSADFEGAAECSLSVKTSPVHVATLSVYGKQSENESGYNFYCQHFNMQVQITAIYKQLYKSARM